MKEMLWEITKRKNSSHIFKEEMTTPFPAPFHFHQGKRKRRCF
jgi:hypothetical protein